MNDVFNLPVHSKNKCIYWYLRFVKDFSNPSNEQYVRGFVNICYHRNLEVKTRYIWTFFSKTLFQSKHYWEQTWLKKWLRRDGFVRKLTMDSDQEKDIISYWMISTSSGSLHQYVQTLHDYIFFDFFVSISADDDLRDIMMYFFLVLWANFQSDFVER